MPSVPIYVLRCAYCHDELGRYLVQGCGSCRTQLHLDCAAALRRCPTLACPSIFPVRVRGYLGEVERPNGGWTTLLGIVLPLICLLLFELGLHFRPSWQHPGPGVWLGLARSAEVHRGLYPLIAWGMAALWAELKGQRAAWIEVGLLSGVLVSFVFSLLYLEILPLSAFMLLALGMGLLGFTPYFALVVYVRALRRYRRAAPAKEAQDRSAPLLLFLGLLGIGAYRTQLILVHAYSRLPSSPPHDCYVATAGSRGHSALTRAELVPGRDGRPIPVSRQLRVLKLGEYALGALAPSLHRALRLVYDRVGPPLANRMGTSTATLAYLALKPFEWATFAALWLLGGDPEPHLARVYRAEPSPEEDS